MSVIQHARDLPASVVLPDVERLVYRWLAADAAVTALAPSRVFTAFPSDAGNAPLVVITRIGGAPAFTWPLVFEQAALQLDVYGGKKREAQLLARTVQSVLAVLEGVQSDGVNDGAVTCELGPFRYIPDESFDPARPRYVLDVTVNVKAAGATV